MCTPPGSPVPTSLPHAYTPRQAGCFTAARRCGRCPAVGSTSAVSVSRSLFAPSKPRVTRQAVPRRRRVLHPRRRCPPCAALCYCAPRVAPGHDAPESGSLVPFAAHLLLPLQLPHSPLTRWALCSCPRAWRARTALPWVTVGRSACSIARCLPALYYTPATHTPCSIQPDANRCPNATPTL